MADVAQIYGLGHLLPSEIESVTVQFTWRRQHVSGRATIPSWASHTVLDERVLSK